MMARRSRYLVVALSGLGVFGRESLAIPADVNADGPDLSVVSLAVASERPTPGAPVSLDLVVRSTGPCMDCGPVQISYWDDSDDGDVSCSDGATLNTVAQIPPQSEATVHVVLNGYPRPGKYRAWVWVDCQAALAESNETNNKGYVDIEVSGIASDPAKPADSGQPPDGSAGAASDGTSDGSQDGGSADPTASASPGFCGILGQSAAAVAAWMSFAVLGLVGLRWRARSGSFASRR